MAKEKQKQNKKAVKKQKGKKIFSVGFMLFTLVIAIVTFYVCLTIGMNIHDTIPF